MELAWEIERESGEGTYVLEEPRED